MFSLTKKTDYALLALCCLALEADGTSMNAKAIAERYSIPVELLAKILQQLTKRNLVDSTSGPTGGYRLSRQPDKISVADVMYAVEGQPALLQCLKGAGDECSQFATCTIRHPMEIVQNRLARVLEDTTIQDLILSESGLVTVDRKGSKHSRDSEQSIAAN